MKGNALDFMRTKAVVDASSEKPLEAIAKRFGVPIVGRHTALGDAAVTAAVFLRMVPMLEAQAPIHMRRKSRYWNALKVLLTLVSITAVANRFPSLRYSIRMDE